jgi:hypothetical protein
MAPLSEPICKVSHNGPRPVLLFIMHTMASAPQPDKGFTRRAGTRMLGGGGVQSRGHMLAGGNLNQNNRTGHVVLPV